MHNRADRTAQDRRRTFSRSAGEDGAKRRMRGVEIPAPLTPTLSRESGRGGRPAEGACLYPPRFHILFLSGSKCRCGGRHAREGGHSPMSAPSERPRGVVTGAGGGIGKAVVRRLLREGARVLAVDAKAEGLAELESADCETLVADVTDPAVRTKIADWADGARYLVNSAGVIVIKPIFDLTVEDWRRAQTVNAEATFFLCQKVGPRLAPGGAIVNLSSSSAKLATTIEVAAYAASKTTILSITRSFAYALAPRRVRVNAILPGIVETAMQEEVLAGVAPMGGLSDAERRKVHIAAVPLGRGSSLEECDGLIWFFLSEEAAYMTGQAVNFPGGLVTW